MSVREAGVKLKSIRAGNTRLGEHYTPQSPACMAGTGRAFICGWKRLLNRRNHTGYNGDEPCVLVQGVFLRW